MVKRIALASVFVAVLAVVGLGFSASASADHCHHRGGYHASYSVYGPAVAVVPPVPAYTAFYAPARVRPIRPLRAYAPPVPVPVPAPVYPASASFRISIGF